MKWAIQANEEEKNKSQTFGNKLSKLFLSSKRSIPSIGEVTTFGNKLSKRTSCSRKSPQLRIVNYILFINSSQTQITYSHKEISTYQSARKVVRDWVFRSNCSKRCCARMSSQENNGQSENRHVIEGPFTQQPRRDDASVIAVPASFFHGHAWMRTASTRKEKRFLTTRTKAGKFSEARFGV